MKHLSLWMTVLLLGAVPLTAAAADYGANQVLLAAATDTQPTSTHTQSPSMSTLPKSGVVESNANDSPDLSPDASRMLRSSAPAATTSDGHEPGAGKQPGATPAPPTSDAGPASWQSMLPGSIQ